MKQTDSQATNDKAFMLVSKRLRRWTMRIALAMFLIFWVVYGIACQMSETEFSRRPEPGMQLGEYATATPWTITYLSGGEPGAPRIIYVHGTPGSASAFDDYLERPIAGFEGFSIDRPGFGDTRPPKPAYTLHEQALVIGPLLVECGGQWPILVGHSLGAPIICRVAAEYPDRVRGLVLLSGSLNPKEEHIAWYQRLGDFAFVPYLLPRWLRNTNRELFPMKKELEELAPMLGELRCPTVIVHAKNDSLVPFGNVQYMRETIPKDTVVKIVELEDKNHFIPWNAESVVRDAIEAVAKAS